MNQTYHNPSEVSAPSGCAHFSGVQFLVQQDPSSELLSANNSSFSLCSPALTVITMASYISYLWVTSVFHFGLQTPTPTLVLLLLLYYYYYCIIIVFICPLLLSSLGNIVWCLFSWSDIDWCSIFQWLFLKTFPCNRYFSLSQTI